MSERSPHVLVEELLEAITYCETFTQGMSFEAFIENALVSSAVLRQIEIIGEVARVFPENYKSLAPDIPWEKVRGLRNRVIHEYFSVSLSTIWTILQRDFPQFKQQVIGLQQALINTSQNKNPPLG